MPNADNDEWRQATPFGLCRYAQEYAQAGRDALEGFRARQPEPQPPYTFAPFPVYFNFLHSIELALKSYMVYTGSSSREMHRVGHDLDAALDICIERGIKDACPSFRPLMMETIRNANELYKRKDFEYIRVGYIQHLEPIDQIVMATDVLLTDLGRIDMLKTSPEWAVRMEESLDQG